MRKPDVDGHWHFSETIDGLLSGKAAVAQIPAQAAPGELQVSIFDRREPDAPLTAAADINPPEQTKVQH